MFKFIHAADIHLDSAREGLQRDADSAAAEIQQAPRRALENLVRLAIEEQVAFVLIAGDLYDGNWPDFHTGLFFLEQVAKLNEAEIRVFCIAGNHDAANVMTRTLLLPATDRIKMFGSRQAESVLLDNLPVAIHGQSFERRAVEEDLAQHFPAAVPGLFNIGLLHTSANYSGGEHDRYAPCAVETLLAKGYDYWALGHIHKRQDLRRTSDQPHLAFPGNLQGRHIRETGPKGCSLVTVDEGHRADVRFCPVDVLRWEHCLVPVSGVAEPEEIVQRVAERLSELIDASDDRPLAVRVELEGPCPAHRRIVSEPHRWLAEVQAAAIQLGQDRLWIERLVRRTSMPQSEAGQAAREGALGELCEFMQQMRQDDAWLRSLGDKLEPLRAKLPPELTEGSLSLQLDDPQRLRCLLEDAEQLLVQRMQSRGVEE